MKILLADDDAVSKRIMQRSVERLGHSCICAANGDEAWEIFKRSPDFDVVISGRQMRGINGEELCALIRGHEQRHGTQSFFVLWTSLAASGRISAATKAGADFYLAKPLHQEQLRTCLNAAAISSSHERPVRQEQGITGSNGELTRQERQDKLGLPSNWHRLLEELEVVRGRAERYGRSYSAMLCGVDSLHRRKDRRGHPIGSKALERVADLISKNLRSGDSVYRYGEQNLLIVFPEQGAEEAVAAADRLRRTVEAVAQAAPLPETSENRGALTLSIGLADSRPESPKSAVRLLAEAQHAFDTAVKQGGNRYEIYHHTI